MRSIRKSGERQPIQPVFSPLAECDYIDVNAVEDFHLSEEAQAWCSCRPRNRRCNRRGMPTGSIIHGYRPKNDSITNGVERFRARDDEQMAAFRQFVADQGDSLSGRQPLMRYMPSK